MKKHLLIRIKGIVQGVGFRPYIFNLAARHNVFGTVINDTEGVLINAEGLDENVSAFISGITAEAPPLSYIRACESEEKKIHGYTDFTIGKSRTTGERMAFYSPDVAMCDKCLEELFDKGNRRNNYPFTTCINCGPRFSIVTDIPYDRKNTSMAPFKMCVECRSEYDSPQDRRFHSQPNACTACGPQMFLYKSNGEPVPPGKNDDVAVQTFELLKRGSIAAIKGIGGYHLAVDAFNDSAVRELRVRKKRPFKPFALMISSMDFIEENYEVSHVEKELLLSKERPIVILKIKNNLLSKGIAPGMSCHGIMLPYSPFHHQLFSLDKNLALVMTSGNISDEPIVYRDDDAFKRLGHIADYVAAYNREIVAQGDDSVLFVEKGRPYFIRRSRGYVPVPFSSSETGSKLMAVGGDLKNSFALARKDFTIISQYLGDMADAYTYEVFKDTAHHFIKIFNADPDVIVSDLHPSYMTTQFADELSGGKTRRLKVQHHHAHIASVLEDNSVDETVIGIAFDGTGYGPDGTLWGSEFLIASRGSYERAGHFSYFPLPGGESAIKDVWKIGLSLLYKTYGTDFPVIKKSMETDMLIQMIENRINSPMTCSIGRIFDGVSAILGVSQSISTEAEAAILLEEKALGCKSDIEHINIEAEHIDGSMVLSTEALVQYIVSLIKKGHAAEEISMSFHKSIVYSSIDLVKKLREKHGINKAALSGGVFHNRIILNMMIDALERDGFEVLLPVNVPFNDECIALGQVAVAKEMLN